MANTVIQLKKAPSSGAVPSALANGEMGLDYFTGNLWFKAANGSYKLINPAGTVGGNGGGVSYGTANINGTLLVAGVSSDILTITSGPGVILTTGGNGPNSFKIDANTVAPSYFSAYTTVNVSYSGSNTSNDLAFDITLYDSAAAFNGIQYVAQVTGLYLFGATVVYQPPAANNIAKIYANYNGTNFIPLDTKRTSGANTLSSLNGSTLISLTVGQTVAISMTSSGTQNCTVFGGTFNLPDEGIASVFWGTLVSATPSLGATGNVSGSGAATNTAIALWNGNTGTSLKSSNVTINSTGDISTVGALNGTSASFAQSGDTATYTKITEYTYSNTSYSDTEVNMYRARGYANTPRAVVSGDAIGLYSFNAYNGTQFEAAGQIVISVDGTNVTGSNNHPSAALHFQTRRANTTQFSLDDALIITGNGGITTATANNYGVDTISAGVFYENGQRLSSKYGSVTNPTSAFLLNKNGTAQNFTTVGPTVISWSTTEYDTGTEVSGNTFVPKNAGKYTIGSTVRITAMGVGTTNMKLHLYKNAALLKTLGQINVVAGITDFSLSGETIADAAASDIFDVRIEFTGLTSGTATIGGAITDSWFVGVREAGVPVTVVNTGNTTINFGTGLGNNETSTVVTGQANILSTSKVQLYFMGDDTTATHTANDHKYATSLMSMTAGTIIPGTGFTIYGRSIHKLTGSWNVRFTWIQ